MTILPRPKGERRTAAAAARLAGAKTAGRACGVGRELAGNSSREFFVAEQGIFLRGAGTFQRRTGNRVPRPRWSKILDASFNPARAWTYQALRFNLTETFYRTTTQS
jgi:hypothetical protein